jgi:protein phosphatase-4 regulatory subunit 3
LSATFKAIYYQSPELVESLHHCILISIIQCINALFSSIDEILSDDATEAAVTTMVQLPMPELGNLEDIESIIRQASSTPGGRDALGKYILNNDYIIKLIPFLEIAEDLESITHLHRLCNIMKMIILLNDTLLVEKIVTDEMVLGVVGILECMQSKFAFFSRSVNPCNPLCDISR